MATIHIVHCNYDYEENLAVFDTEAKAMEWISESFDVDEDFESEPANTPEFWAEVDDAYAAGDWKGFTYHTLDTETLALRKVH